MCSTLRKTSLVATLIFVSALLIGQDLSSEFYAVDGCHFQIKGSFQVSGPDKPICLFGSKNGMGHWVIINHKREILAHGESGINEVYTHGAYGDGKLLLHGHYIHWPPRSDSYPIYYKDLFSVDGQLLKSKFAGDFPLCEGCLVWNDSVFVELVELGIQNYHVNSLKISGFKGPGYQPYYANRVSRRDSLFYILSDNEIRVISLAGFDTTYNLNDLGFDKNAVYDLRAEDRGNLLLGE